MTCRERSKDGGNNLTFSTAQALGREGCADPMRQPRPGPGTVMGQPRSSPPLPCLLWRWVVAGGSGGLDGSPLGSCPPKRSSTAAVSAKTTPGGGRTGPGRSRAAPTPLPVPAPAQGSRLPAQVPLLPPGSGTTSASALLRDHSRKWESGAGKGRSRLALQLLRLLPAPGRALPSHEAEQSRLRWG